MNKGFKVIQQTLYNLSIFIPLGVGFVMSRSSLSLYNDDLQEDDLLEEENEVEDLSFDLEKISDVVVYGTDWTTETILNQLKRNNIELNPRFQRRDAWNLKRKSRFIESLILGLPIPQITLAEKEKGRYIVLDGKQRLLTLLQFYNKSDSPNNHFRLQDLEFLTELNHLTYTDITTHLFFVNYINALDNQTIRTTLIRNWQNEGFLYKVFLRLNMENTPLSPQELRQALNPGKFIDYLDDKASESENLKIYFNSNYPDFRMRDTQLLLKYIAFQFFLSDYKGSLKQFLDKTCRKLNKEWEEKSGEIEDQVEQFEEAMTATIEIFTSNNFAKIWLGDKTRYDTQRNQSVLEVMLFYFSNKKIRDTALEKSSLVEEAFQELCADSVKFVQAMRSSTASLENTYNRLSLWGEKLREVLKIDFNIPQLVDHKIVFTQLL